MMLKNRKNNSVLSKFEVKMAFKSFLSAMIISRMSKPILRYTLFFYKHQVYKHTQPQIIVFISKSLSTLQASDSVLTVFSLGFHVPAPPGPYGRFGGWGIQLKS
jgi:hypothetical protein